MKKILTRISIAEHLLTCFIWRMDPQEWTADHISRERMRRVSEDRKSWEYRAMTDAEYRDAEWMWCIR